MSPEAQEAFLKRQGYRRPADLLAHVAAWWKAGLQLIEQYKVDPSASQPQVDVDSFNAEAVASVRDLSEGEVIRLFEAMRRKFVESVRSLSEADFQNERIVGQLKMELINHLMEHRIP